MKQWIKDKAWMSSRHLMRGLRNLPGNRRHHSSLPVIFSNSFPKSGTNLMRQVFLGWVRMEGYVDWSRNVIATFENDSGRKRSDQEILVNLSRMKPGEIWSGHLFHSPALEEKLTEPGIVNYFIYRDPRDVVVSHAYYVTYMAHDHVHHDYYLNHLETEEDRIRTSILGLPGVEVEFPDIGKRFEPYIDWLDCGDVMSVKFEDLVENQTYTLQNILTHFMDRVEQSRYPEQDWIQSIKMGIQPSQSPTYREGKTGGWRQKFSENSKDLFKEVAGDLLIQLGYEKDRDW